jgi:5-methylthioadenosine/S-adenosylhomocysteine deaminase
MQAELLIHADWILPVDATDRCLAEGHSLAVDHGRIAALLPRAEAETQIEAMRAPGSAGHALIPGLINAHTHSPMTLLRGLADDLPLMTWLHEHIWPAEGRWVDTEFVADGTRLAVLEMLRGGVTCFNDMYFYPEVTARVAAEAGMRVVAGMIVVDFPTRYAESADDYLRRGLELHERISGPPAGAHRLRAPLHLRRLRSAADACARWPMSWTCRCTSTCTRPTTRSCNRCATTASAPWRGSIAWACSARGWSPCT